MFPFPCFLDIRPIGLPWITYQIHSALINSDSEIFHFCFSAVHYLKVSEQRWFSSERNWKRKFSNLKNSAVSALISSETAPNSADFWQIQNGNFCLIFQFYSKILFIIFEASQFWGTWFLFSAQYTKSSEQQKFTCSIFLQAKDIIKTWIFGFVVTAQVTKQIWFNFSKNVFAFSGMNFQDYLEKLSFHCHFVIHCHSFLGKFTFSLKQEYHFKDHSVRFYHF